MFSFRDELDLFGSDGLRSHALRVMQTVDQAVQNLGSLNKIAPLLRDLGAKHRGYGASAKHCEYRAHPQRLLALHDLVSSHASRCRAE